MDGDPDYDALRIADDDARAELYERLTDLEARAGRDLLYAYREYLDGQHKDSGYIARVNSTLERLAADTAEAERDAGL